MPIPEAEAKLLVPTGEADDHDDDDGKTLGVVMFSLLVVSLVCAWFLPWVSLICDIAAIIIASILTCGCCCASGYDHKPNVKRFLTATLVCMILQFIILIILVIWGVAAGAHTTTTTVHSMSDVPTWEQNTEATIKSAATTNAGLVAVGVINLVLSIMAIIFAGLYTWGRKCFAK
ncbi:hypothetical protein ACHAWF_006152 [Thalassiosira exigua]